MGFHAFSLDPRTILGVGPDASLEEIHEAYRAKSKKHHPDRGGDDWAFRMVARAYEVLKATAAAPARAAAQPWEARGARVDLVNPGRSADGSWNWGTRLGWPPAAAGDDDGTMAAGRPEDATPTTAVSEATAGSDGPPIDPERVRTVDVELIWTRFEK